MITITKRGGVSIDDNNDFLLCNRPAIVVESVKEFPTSICVNKTIKNPYTISYASQGTLVSFFSVLRKNVNKTMIEKAWFVDFERAYFLCTLSHLDGYAVKRGQEKLGNIILNSVKEEWFQKLDTSMAYTFLLDRKGKLKIIYIWSIDEQMYISPFSNNINFSKFIIKKDGSITTNLNKSQMKHPIMEVNKTENSVKLEDGKPLLVNIYCGNIIYSIRILTRTDYKINKIRNSASSKYEALLLARFKGDDTLDFETRYFNKKELQEFENKLEMAFVRFKQEIYQKCVLRNWVCFPDKLYNTIRLGDIIDNDSSLEEKQEIACNAIKSCTKGWRKKALIEFYRSYAF